MIMINSWTNFKKHMQERLNEDVNYHAMKMCGYYRVNEEQISYMLHDLALNKIEHKYDPNKNIIEIETFHFDKPYEIILKNGCEKLSLSLEDRDYDHDCVILKSKPMDVPDGAYM